MLTPNDIGDRLEELVRERFPGEEVYRELCPQGFARPCTLIVQEPFEGDANFGAGVVELRPVFTLTTFVETDDYHYSHLAPMHLRQMALTGLFLPGYIRVGGRAPHVTKLALAGGYDYDKVMVTFSVTLDRSDFMELEEAPLAGDVSFRLNISDKE